MFKWHLVKTLPRKVVGSVFFVSFLLLQVVVADVEAPTLQYIARSLLPNECQSIITYKNAEPFNAISPIANPHESPSSGIDCFRKLVGWASNLRINRRDANLLLENRLRQIGRNDLAAWFVGSLSRGRAITKEIIEYESWNSKESNRKSMSSSDPTISKINALLRGPPERKSIADLPPGLREQSISSFPDVRKLTGISRPDSFKDHYLALAEPESGHPVTSAPEYVASEHRKECGDPSGISKENDSKDSQISQTAGGKLAEDKKHDKSRLSKMIPHFSDEKTAPCLRVPLSTALVVIGTIMTLTCCCALLLRNRLVACFERLRRRKPAASKRMSVDEEQGFMGPRTLGKTPKRSGRKGGGPIDVANVGVQNTNAASNASGESDEKLTGCCTCAKKKKRNRRKWKK